MIRQQRHPSGLVGNIFRIKNPSTISIGHSFMAGRLLPGDLVLCIGHSGDCFQDYVPVAEYANGLSGLPKYKFGSYYIGDSELVCELKKSEAALLEEGEVIIPLPASWPK